MKVLLIEDDIQSSFLIEKFLSQNNYTVFPAKDSQSAMKIAQEQKPQYVISDWNIFDSVSGIEVTKAITILAPEVEVIFISGYPKDEIERMVLTAGLRTLAILEKPIDLSELIEALNRGTHIACNA